MRSYSAEDKLRARRQPAKILRRAPVDREVTQSEFISHPRIALLVSSVTRLQPCPHELSRCPDSRIVRIAFIGRSGRHRGICDVEMGTDGNAGRRIGRVGASGSLGVEGAALEDQAPTCVTSEYLSAGILDEATVSTIWERCVVAVWISRGGGDDAGSDCSRGIPLRQNVLGHRYRSDSRSSWSVRRTRVRSGSS